MQRLVHGYYLIRHSPHIENKNAFVATLVDVTGVLIYFTMATLILKGTLL